MSWTTGINCLSPVQYWVKVGALALSNLFKKCSYGDSRVLGYFHWGEWFVFLFSNTFEYLFRGSSDLFQASETFFLLTDKILQFTVIEMDFPGLSRLSFYPFFSNIAFILILTSCNIDLVGWDSVGMSCGLYRLLSDHSTLQWNFWSFQWLNSPELGWWSSNNSPLVFVLLNWRYNGGIRALTLMC